MTMKEQLQQRIEQLTEEYRSGEKMLADLDQRRAELQATMLRISGALQVLQELVGPTVADEAEPASEATAAAS
jgi:prefoldin subunit 5